MIPAERDQARGSRKNRSRRLPRWWRPPHHSALITRRGSFRLPSTPSSTRSPMKSPYGTLLQERRKVLHAPHRRRDRALLSGPTDRARGRAGSSRGTWSDVGARGAIPALGGREGRGALGQPRGDRALRAGPGRASTAARDLMNAGEPMTNAWVTIAPQNPRLMRPDIPDTVYVPGTGGGVK